MVVKLIEVVERRSASSTFDMTYSYSLREVFVNPDQVVCLREDARMKQSLNEGKLPAELSSAQQFTKIHMNRGNSGLDIVVVGPPHIIEEKIFKTKQLLKG